MDLQAETLKQSFLGWQCRLRQIAVREKDGRPTTGMMPQISLQNDGRFSNAITVLIIRRDATNDASQFRHLVLKSHDPADRFASGLEFLSATHYQRPHEFSDEMTGLFQPGDPLVRALLAEQACILEFEQFSAAYTLPCAVRQLNEDESAFQATYWHNRLFNPTMPGNVVVLGFAPDWDCASASMS